ncbi:MAG: hypothetical protein O7G85_00345 [Planctomycetota bacterium]|nr:hypothetical protein [Planctomycetota bacterium]
MRTALRSLLIVTFIATMIALPGCSQNKTSNFASTSSSNAQVVSQTDEGITYHYYPSVEVYFDPNRDVYFWHASAYWGVGKRLPSTYKLSESDRKMVTLDTKMPYRRHQEVMARYPKPQLDSIFATAPTDQE